MNYFFLDASALVKRYHQEPGSDVVNRLLDELLASSPARVAISPLGLAETVSVLNRRRNEGRIPHQLFQLIVVRLLLEARAVAVQSVDDDLILESIPFIMKHNINSSDALYLYQALNLQHLLRPVEHDLVLVASDRRFLRAAEAEGLAVINPEAAEVAEAATLLSLGQEPGEPEFPR